ncbi:transposase [Oceanicoccus sp. KOV_DT_Chl]|uniref:transposase n=1 Tax=Oceanicoccus sp. KOV_DT_Chl TaxID=1904639 RepID=UPI00190EAB8E|nr:transposase [Oceanicoccus sp. KOV_DT_Chl]
MNKKDLEAFAREAAKGIKTEQDLRVMLTKVMVEAALSAELDDHLGYSKHEQSTSENSRNGVTRKTVRTEDGQFAHIGVSAYRGQF